MDRVLSVLAGVGLGAGLMYILDPQMGRRRRALARDKMVRLGHQTQEAAEVVGKDMKNRAKGLASGDPSVLVGGKRALQHPLRGGWSPAGRTIMGGLGAGMLAYGVTREAPTACVLGTMGLALVAEGLTNTGWSDVTETASSVAHKARETASGMTGASSQKQAAGRQNRPQPATSGAR